MGVADAHLLVSLGVVGLMRLFEFEEGRWWSVSRLLCDESRYSRSSAVVVVVVVVPAESSNMSTLTLAPPV
jgi:hypothetical protein